MAPQIEMIPPDALRSWAKNARTHSRKQVKQIAESIRTFGFTNPILVDADETILAGHGRVEAAKLIGMERVPCVRIEHMTPEQKRAYVLADNKLALNAGWDDQLLAEELRALSTIDLDFDIEVTGFAIAEIDSLIEGLIPEEPGNPDDDVVLDDAIAPRVRTGDIWRLGPHRLVCGSALDRQVVAALMDGEIARMVFTDPPYNVPIDGHVGNSGKIKHREFAMASGEMSKTEFETFLTTAFNNLAAYAVDGSIHFICMDWRHVDEMLAAGGRAYTELKNLIVWVKDNGGMGTFYRSRHELIFAFKNGTAPHINSFELGQHGRYRTNVWQYRGVNTLKAGRMEELGLHPTVKPVQMIADAIKDVSGRGDIVLDLFGGSGSTLKRSRSNSSSCSLLAGRVFDKVGNRLTPTHAAKANRRYRYYATTTGQRPEMRFAASDLERAVFNGIATWVRQFDNVVALVSDGDQSIDAFERAQKVGSQLVCGGSVGAAILRPLLDRVEVGKSNIAIHIRRHCLRELLDLKSSTDTDGADILIEEALVLARGRKAQKLVIGSEALRPNFNAGLAAAILRARRWFEHLRDRRVASITELAEQEGLPRAWISQQLPLAFLAPDIVEVIASGRQAASLTLDRLVAVASASSEWVAQRTALG